MLGRAGRHRIQQQAPDVVLQLPRPAGPQARARPAPQPWPVLAFQARMQRSARAAAVVGSASPWVASSAAWAGIGSARSGWPVSSHAIPSKPSAAGCQPRAQGDQRRLGPRTRPSPIDASAARSTPGRSCSIVRCASLSHGSFGIRGRPTASGGMNVARHGACDSREGKPAAVVGSCVGRLPLRSVVGVLRPYIRRPAATEAFLDAVSAGSE
jgi:hypothetical protein